MDKRSPISSLNAAIAFIVTALIASILLISALVLFLGEVIGSHLLSMVLVGGICGVASWVIYSNSLKPVIRELENQITTIYEVAHAARRAYEWTVEYVVAHIFK